MDNVLADFDRSVGESLSRHGLVPVPLAERRTRRYADDHPQWRRRIEEITRAPGFFARLPSMPFAIEGWARVRDAGWTPRICTAVLQGSPTCEADKRTWIDRYFPPGEAAEAISTMIFTSQKADSQGIALIDDNPRIARASKADWTHVVFDRAFNRATPGPRLHGWLDPNLESMLNALVVPNEE